MTGHFVCAVRFFTQSSFKGRLHGAFSMCVSMSDKPFDAEACNIGGQASATNGLSDMKTPSKTHRVIDPLACSSVNAATLRSRPKCHWTEGAKTLCRRLAKLSQAKPADYFGIPWQSSPLRWAEAPLSLSFSLVLFLSLSLSLFLSLYLSLSLFLSPSLSLSLSPPISLMLLRSSRQISRG
jgi:hypothetical protein